LPARPSAAKGTLGLDPRRSSLSRPPQRGLELTSGSAAVCGHQVAAIHRTVVGF